MSLVDVMRDSRRSPLVLKTQLMGVRSRSEDVYIFIFEGPEDVPVYEEWLRRLDAPSYEALPGAGKEQLLSLREMLRDDQLIRRVYFFVDADFDALLEEDVRVFVLDAYSIENLIVGRDVLESLLRDEFRCAGLIEDKCRVHERYEEFMRSAKERLLDLHRIQFIARREGLRASTWPEKITSHFSVSLRGVDGPAIDWMHQLGYSGRVSVPRMTELGREFAALPFPRAQRGKYILQIFRAWIGLVFADRRSPTSTLFSQSIPTLGGDPQNSSMRRFAAAAAPPVGLRDFIANAALELST